MVFYACNVCSSLRMTYAQILEHSVTFCARNYRQRCTYCSVMATRCKCTSHRNNLMEIIFKMITECKSFDLYNNSHRFISHIYTIYKMQLVNECLNDIILTGEYVEEELISIPMIDIQYREGVQTHNENGVISFHIVQPSSCGIKNNIPVSYLINSLEEAGTGLKTALIKYYSEVSNPNHLFVQTQDFHIHTNLTSYPKVN